MQLTLHVGQVVDVIVKSVQTFGLFCKHDGGIELLVRIPEISWTASFSSCDQFADVGDSISVKILAVDEASGKIDGSIRQRFSDPWDTDALEVGQSHTATVIRHIESADRCKNGPAYLLEVTPGSFAILCGSDTDLMPGDLCDVAITSSNRDSRSVSISRLNAV